MTEVENEKGFIAHPIERAVRLTGLSRSSIYVLIKSGEIGISKIGRRTVIPDSDLRNMIERHRSAQPAAGE